MLVSCNKLLCIKDTGSPTLDLLKIKILLNSTISNTSKDIKFMMADIKNYFFTILI